MTSESTAGAGIYDDFPLRHEALRYRAGVRDLRRQVVAAA